MFQVLPLVMNYLTLNECLLLRQANKDLKRMVDSTFQRLSTHPQEKFVAALEMELNKDFPKRRNLSRGQQLRTLAQVESLFRDTSTWLVPQGNPWLVGHVELDLRLMGGQNHLRLLISRFGIHISSLTVIVYSSENNQVGMVNLMLELLSSVNFPYLKQLQLVGTVEKGFVSCLRARLDAFPKLPKLETLHLIDLGIYLGLGDDGDLALPFLEKYGSQLTILHCKSSLLSFWLFSLNRLNSLLPNVSSLELGFLGLGSNGIAKLSQIGWKIKHLAVPVDSVNMLKVSLQP